MAVRVKPLDEMLRDVLASLQAGVRGRPVFTLLLGSGFSYPIVPTPSQMLKSDIAWWRYCKDRGITEPFCDRDTGVAAGLAKAQEIAEFEQKLWSDIHSRCTGDEARRFPLADGLPNLSDPESVGRAYDAIMSEGLLNNRMRRQYLRDAIARSGRKVNGAHIYLAGVLEAQERWEWGAPFCRTIFTTNFDPLLQRSLQLVNKLYYMTDRPEVLDAPDDDRSDAIHLVYTHGSVHRYELLNTGEQIEKARRENAARLVDYFTRHGVIVMGYSGWRDTTMEALRLCSSFDSNLYWCDIHPADQAEAKLRPEVLDVLRAGEKGAWYVPISSADETMRQLHRALNLGDVPKFILAPVPTLIEQLQSIEVPAKASSEEEIDRTLAGDSMAELLSGTLDRLKVAQQAFDDPSVVKAVSVEAENDVARALIAQLMSDALVADRQNKPEQAIALWSAVIVTPGVPAADRARALRNRGLAQRAIGKIAEAIDDYSAVITMADAPVERKAMALVSRGLAQRAISKTAEAIEDYSAVIAMADAPVEQKAWALINRGVAQGASGNSAEALEDYSAVIAMADAPAEQKAMALRNRGLAQRAISKTAEAIEDYSAVIAMADAPAEQKARALINRGVAQEARGNSTEAIEDYSAVMAMTDAPAEQKARALVNRGVAQRALGKIAEATEDYSAVITMAEVPVEQKAWALINRGIAQGASGNSAEAIEDYSAVIAMADTPAEPKARALINRGVAQEARGNSTEAIEDYSAVIAMADAPVEQKARALVNRGVAQRALGKIAEAIEDYSAVIAMADAPAEQKARALINRGVAQGASGNSAEELEDYSAVIAAADAPAEQKARALLNRGLAQLAISKTAEAIEDYSAVIAMADAPATQKASALINRGVAQGTTGNSAEAIEDYSAVIAMADAPVEQKALALRNRGFRHGADGRTAQAIDDYSAVIGMADAPAEQKALALWSRGALHSAGGRTAQAIDDYSAVIAMADAPAEQKATALVSRSWAQFTEDGDIRSLIDDSREALTLVGTNNAARANLALGLLLAGDVDGALAEYEQLSHTAGAKMIGEAINDLRAEMAKVADLAGAERALSLLTNAP